MSAFFGVPVSGGVGSTLSDIGKDATAGSVIFADGSGLAESNSSFFWDDTDKRLGIGTASPAAHLEVTPDAVKSDETPEEIFQVTERAHTSLSDAEYTAVLFDLSATVEFDGAGGISDQRAIRVLAPTYAAEAAQTITRAATVYIDAAPTAGVNVTLTDSYALWVDAGDVRFDGQILSGDGSGAAPGYSFTSGPGAGIFYDAGNDEIHFSTDAHNDFLSYFASNSTAKVVAQNNRQFVFEDSRAAGSSITALIFQSGAARTAGKIAQFRSSTTELLSINFDGSMLITHQAATSGTPGEVLHAVEAAHTSLADAEYSSVLFDLSATVEFDGAADFSPQRAFRILAPTYAAEAAHTIAASATLYIDNAPQAGANVTLTDAYALWVDAGMIRADGDGTHVFDLPQDDTDPTGGGGAATGRIPIQVGGATRYLPYYT